MRATTRSISCTLTLLFLVPPLLRRTAAPASSITSMALSGKNLSCKYLAESSTAALRLDAGYVTW